MEEEAKKAEKDLGAGCHGGGRFAGPLVFELPANRKEEEPKEEEEKKEGETPEAEPAKPDEEMKKAMLQTRK